MGGVIAVRRGAKMMQYDFWLSSTLHRYIKVFVKI